MKSRTINHALLPTLTDTVDGTPIGMPVLTRTIEKPVAAGVTLSEEQCQQLAKRLFPKLEATLRDAIGTRSEAKWEKAMQEVRNELPELIRKAAHKPL